MILTLTSVIISRLGLRLLCLAHSYLALGCCKRAWSGAEDVIIMLADLDEGVFCTLTEPSRLVVLCYLKKPAVFIACVFLLL